MNDFTPDTARFFGYPDSVDAATESDVPSSVSQPVERQRLGAVMGSRPPKRSSAAGVNFLAGHMRQKPLVHTELR